MPSRRHGRRVSHQAAVHIDTESGEAVFNFAGTGSEERRYPVILQQFSLAEDTGGAGQYRGGDGVRREILFRKDLELSVLTERRVLAPYGLAGGEPGLSLGVSQSQSPVLIKNECE
jgi:hypothetical protein